MARVASLSVFRFPSLGSKLWAFGQMGLARRKMRSVPDLDFYKLLGTGSGQGFTPIPNFSVYGILGTWPSLEAAQTGIANSSVFQAYEKQSSEQAHLYMSAIQCRGLWDKTAPFDVDEEEREKGTPEPLAVLTRATIRPSKLYSFWKHTPGISKMIEKEENIAFKIGLGEIPWLHQVTFSIWDSRQAMVAFAHKGGCHAIAAKEVTEGEYFSEELFARFKVLDAHGSWEGKELSGLVSKESSEIA